MTHDQRYIKRVITNGAPIRIIKADSHFHSDGDEEGYVALCGTRILAKGDSPKDVMRFLFEAFLEEL